MKYTEDTFYNFTKKKQGKKLTELIAKIESTWDNESVRIALLKEFQRYLKIMKYPTKMDFTTLAKREFLTLAVPIEQEFEKHKKDDEIIILKQDGKPKELNKIPLILILDDLRSAFNVGSIFRTAECFGISHIHLCGYTPTPENKKVQKTAMGTEEFVDWSVHANIIEVIEKLKNDGVTVYGLETTKNSKDITKIKFKQPSALILGNEALGISEKVLKQADEILQIPMQGWKNSLNVGVCSAISCYEISRQWSRKL